MTMPVFDELHVVSDLHLGGGPGFQIFNQGARLAAFIQRLAEPSEHQIGFVLNGDIVDFLAEDSATYLDPLGAIGKLERICKDPAFSMIWQSLQDFVKQPSRQLVLVLGNHDVELALPPVKEWLLGYLTNGDAAARGRITFAVDGAGYACKVHDKHVLCLHGNEVDIWNVVDYRALLEVSRALNRGEPPSKWDVNAGTRLVIDIMNKVKQKFPMVDLLKPEIEAVLPVVAALDVGQLTAIAKLLRVVRDLSRDRIRRSIGLLSAETEAEESLPSEAEEVTRFIQKNFHDYPGSTQDDVGNLLMQAYSNIKRGYDPKEQQDHLNMEYLGFRNTVKKYFEDEWDKEALLRKVLRKLLHEDRTFDITFPDDTFKALDREIGPGVDYLIAGHTHLERALQRSYPGHYYFNSGTWIRLIQLSEEVLNEASRFSRVYKAFENGSMNDLDEFVQLRPTVVSIVREHGHTCAGLGLARDDGSVELNKDTRFPRS
jgi:UDP-2,3-diacylglucosamine pyrophosphatase LpxH